MAGSPQEVTGNTLPHGAEALVAATMTLMSVWADVDPPDRVGAGVPRQQLACRIVANLCQLSRHPQLGEPLRIVMARAHARWARLAAAEPAAPRPHAAAAGQALH